MKNLKWYKVHEIAKKTGLSRYRIRTLIDNGTIIGTRINGERLVEERHLKEFSEQVMLGLVDVSKRTTPDTVRKDLDGWDDPIKEGGKQDEDIDIPDPEELSVPEREALKEHLERKRIREIMGEE